MKMKIMELFTYSEAYAMVQKSFLCLMYNYFNNSQEIACM